MNVKTGFLLLNLGTPDAPTKRAVRSYLKEFLNDPRVIDLPWIVRWILVNIIIVPFRAGQSAEAYQAIWQKEGSPLLFNSEALCKALQKKLPKNVKIALGMRYGQPSVESALNDLKECNHITLVPLFPQYASAVTGSVLEEAFRIMGKWKNIPSLKVMSSFYQDPGFVRSYADVINTTIQKKKVDFILFSYHGLPERQLDSSTCFSECVQKAPCPVKNISQHSCYRAQCYITTRLLAEALELSENAYLTAFQSRLGKTPWIKPYSDQVLPDLITKGVKNIAVVCPSFVSDCLETIEEIGMRMQETWKELGGEGFALVPALNSNLNWVDAVSSWVEAVEKT